LELRIINDDRSDLDGLAETHIVALESTAYQYSGSSVATRDNGAINLLVKHPVDAVKLMLKVREACPQRTNLGCHTWNTWSVGTKLKLIVFGQAKIREFPFSIFVIFLDIVFLFSALCFYRTTSVSGLDKLVRAATMVKIRLLVAVIICIILVEEDRRVPVHRLVRGMLVDVGREIAHVAAVSELYLNVAAVYLLEATIIRGVIHRLKLVV
jgi:hypothetical protein